MRRLGHKCGISRVSGLDVKLAALMDGFPAFDRTQDTHVAGQSLQGWKQCGIEHDAASELLEIRVARIPPGILDVESVQLARRALEVDEDAGFRRALDGDVGRLDLGVAPPRQSRQRRPGSHALEPFPSVGLGTTGTRLHGCSPQ